MDKPQCIVIGAGFGGLAAAIRAAAAGWQVTVVETALAPGGKARTVPSPAGPIDTGPTVLTLRREFDALFALGGARLDDHVTLIPQPILARHFWADGSRLDLHADPEASLEAIRAFAGPREAAAFRRFDALSAALFQAFDLPVMQAARPDLPAIARAALRQPRLWPALVPGRSLLGFLRAHFRDPRLVQLFARYATYVGGHPGRSPAVLALIWRAEGAGVWAVQGGLSTLARELAALAGRMGVQFRYGTAAQSIARPSGRASSILLADGTRLAAEAVIFNGDPAALGDGLLGDGPRDALPARATRPRSLSAHVWAVAATPKGAVAPDLIHHNVFFSADPAREWGPLSQGRPPEDPTLYLCAEDRAFGPPPQPLERFEIIVNAPSETQNPCPTPPFPDFRRFGLDLMPQAQSLTTPSDLARLFPGSRGAIYGRSPEGTLAAFARPPARTGLPGLYLAGGGAHPGAGVPMATLSGRFAAEAMQQDRISALASGRTAMPGGISTGSKTAPVKVEGGGVP